MGVTMFPMKARVTTLPMKAGITITIGTIQSTGTYLFETGESKDELL
jgi:hypothetical protein